MKGSLDQTDRFKIHDGIEGEEVKGEMATKRQKIVQSKEVSATASD